MEELPNNAPKSRPRARALFNFSSDRIWNPGLCWRIPPNIQRVHRGNPHYNFCGWTFTCTVKRCRNSYFSQCSLCTWSSWSMPKNQSGPMTSDMDPVLPATAVSQQLMHFPDRIGGWGGHLLVFECSLSFCILNRYCSFVQLHWTRRKTGSLPLPVPKRTWRTILPRPNMVTIGPQLRRRIHGCNIN